VVAPSREVGLPEKKVFRDTGCSMHPTCLGNDDYPPCPLPFCIYDDPPAAGAAAAWERWEEVQELHSRFSPADIAAEMACSERTVQRILREGVGAARKVDDRYEDNREKIRELWGPQSIYRAAGPPALAAPGSFARAIERG